MFKGMLEVGKIVTATFQSDFSNQSSALLFIGFGAVGQESKTDSEVIAPGASGSVSIRPDAEGVVRVLIDVDGPQETGRLEIISGGEAKAASPIAGDTTWTYLVAKSDAGGA